MFKLLLGGWQRYLLLGVVAGLVSGVAGWSLRGRIDDASILETRLEFESYKTAISQDVARANQSALDETTRLQQTINKLRAKQVEVTKTNSLLSQELLLRLSNEPTAKDPVCIPDAEYLRGLRDLKSSSSAG